MKRIVFFFIIWVVTLYAVSYFADGFLPYDPSFPYADALLPSFAVPRWIYSWANFDGIHYLTIAEHGYIGTGLIQAFFPVYPGLMWFDTFFRINPIISGQSISLVAFFSLLVIWKKLISMQFSKKIANTSMLVLMLFPTSFFFMAVYTESLFLLLVLLVFYTAQKQKWGLAILCAAIASGTKVVGIALLPALYIEYLYQRNLLTKQLLKKPLSLVAKLKIADYKKLSVLLLSGFGLYLYMVFLYQEFRDPLYFFSVQEEFGGGRSESLVLLPQVMFRYIKILATAEWQSWSYFAYAQEFMLSLLTLGTLVVAWLKKYRPSYMVFATLAFLIPTFTGTFSSMPRYILACFPVFLVIAEHLEQQPKLRFVWYTVTGILLVLNTVLFIQGYWVA